MMHLLLSLSTSKAKLEEEWQEVNGEGLGMKGIRVPLWRRGSYERVKESNATVPRSGSRLLSSPAPEGRQILL